MLDFKGFRRCNGKLAHYTGLYLSINVAIITPRTLSQKEQGRVRNIVKSRLVGIDGDGGAKRQYNIITRGKCKLI